MLLLTRPTSRSVLALFLPVFLAIGLHAGPAQALPALFDFGDGAVQDGWAQVPSSNPTATSEGIDLTLTPVLVAFGERDRGLANGGGNENDMWRDFFFGEADGTISPVTRGFDIALGGLVPDAIYEVTIWSFDVNSATGGGRSGLWNGELLTFLTDPPESLDDLALTIQVTADATGTALVEGRSSSNIIFTGPFINGMRVDLSPIPEPSTALLLGLGLLGLARRRG